MSSTTFRLSALVATTSLAALATSGVAFAGALDEPTVEAAPITAPAAPIASRFAGGYVGGQVGYGYADIDTDNDGDIDNDGILDTIDNSIDATVDTFRAIGEDGDGATGGVHAGYLWNSGQFVYGAEADYDFADIQLDNNSGDVSGIARLKAKGGYDFGNTLVYATAGAAYADADINGSDANDTGWVAGAGVDYLLTDQWSVGAEALYHDFGEFDNTDTDLSLTTVAARVSYRF